MTILFRYILREYARIFLMCFAGLMTIYLVIDFFEKVRRFLRYDASWIDVLTYFALKTPAISFQIVPLAVLMATLLTLGLLSRNHEITAMRSCGISLAWIASPFLAFAVGIAMILLWFSASIIPIAADKAEDIRVTKIEKRLPAATLTIQQPWISVGPQTLLNVTSGAIGGSTIGGIRLFHFDQGYHLVDLTDAEEARYTNEGWTLYRGRHRRFLPDGSVSVVVFDQQPIALPLIPEDFTSRFGSESEAMTFRDIRSYTTRLSHEGAQLSRLLTDYYSRIAFPFVTIVMVLVGIAMSLRRSGARGGGMAIGIGQALAIGFCYWATHSIAIALGRGGALEPMMAGWTANLLFMSFALYLMLKVRY